MKIITEGNNQIKLVSENCKEALTIGRLSQKLGVEAGYYGRTDHVGSDQYAIVVEIPKLIEAALK
jgi:hypothetical protein